jgi:hypothetical protein
MITVIAETVVEPQEFILGVTQPDASNTGRADSGLTTHSGDWIITTDNVTIENFWVEGLVDIQANNVTFKNNIVVSRVITSYPGFDALVRSSGSNNIISNNTLIQYNSRTGTDTSIYYVVGVKLTGGSSTVSRNDISNVNDCVYITGGTHQILGNYFHDLGFRTDDADQAGSTPASWSHNDGVQIRGGTNHNIEGNHFDMAFSTLTGMNSTPNPDPNAEQWWPNCHGILAQGANNAATGITITNNWFSKGACCMHFTSASFSGNTATFTGNRYTPNQSKEFNVYTQIRIDPTTVWTVTDGGGNVYSNDADTPVDWQGDPLKAPTTVSTTKVWQFDANNHTP